MAQCEINDAEPKYISIFRCAEGVTMGKTNISHAKWVYDTMFKDDRQRLENEIKTARVKTKREKKRQKQRLRELETLKVEWNRFVK